jgi:peptide-methionine (S)-S-oxide reductase
VPFEKATFGAGCFWGVEENFGRIPGVKSTIVGFMGGVTENPTYHQVCEGNTGHAEVVHLEFDPSEVSFESLLRNFWSMHNPTTWHRQGPDVGSQYRSVVFCHNTQQENAALKVKEEIQKSGKYSKPIVTEIMPAAAFYRAEEYHQQYLKKRGIAHCHTSG